MCSLWTMVLCIAVTLPCYGGTAKIPFCKKPISTFIKLRYRSESQISLGPGKDVTAPLNPLSQAFTETRALSLDWESLEPFLGLTGDLCASSGSKNTSLKVGVLERLHVLSRVWLSATSRTVAGRAPLHGIFQARILEWVAISFSGWSSWPRDRTCIFCVSCTGRQVLYH